MKAKARLEKLAQADETYEPHARFFTNLCNRNFNILKQIHHPHWHDPNYVRPDPLLAMLEGPGKVKPKPKPRTSRVRPIAKPRRRKPKVS